MSGFIGEVPKKITRGWMEIPDKSNIIMTDDLGNVHPHFGSKRVIIRKAWIGDNDKNPRLVLYSEKYYISSSIPYSFTKGCSVVYNDKIHILGGGKSGESDYEKGHYIYDGEIWTPSERGLPYRFVDGGSVVYNNKIHILGLNESSWGNSWNKHYSWDGTSWTFESTLPVTDFREGITFVYNDKIYILGGRGDDENYFTSLYSWDGTSWTKEATDFDGDRGFGTRLGSVVVYNNKIYKIGGLSYDGYPRSVMYEIYYDSYYSRYDERSISIPYGPVRCSAVVYDNKIHVFGGNYNYQEDSIKHYSWDGISWKREWDIPYNYYGGGLVDFKQEMYLLGGDTSSHNVLETNENGYFK